jgi:hypothetical protein
MRTAFVILLAATAGLAGCNSKPNGGASGQAASTPAPAAAPSTPVSPADVQVPRLKPGLWEIATDMTVDGKSLFGGKSGMAMPKMQMCVDQTYDSTKTWRDQMKQVPPECAKPAMERRADGAIALHMSCTPKSGKAVALEGLISGDFSNNYKVDMTTTGTDDKGVTHNIHMVMSQTRVGDCAPGQKGGSLIINGQPVQRPPQQ